MQSLSRGLVGVPIRYSRQRHSMGCGNQSLALRANMGSLRIASGWKGTQIVVRRRNTSGPLEIGMAAKQWIRFPPGPIFSGSPTD